MVVRTPELTKRLMLSKQEHFLFPHHRICTTLVPLPTPYRRDQMTALEPWPLAGPHLWFHLSFP